MNISKTFRLKNINETRNFLIEEIKQNGLMSKKHKNICTALSYIEHLLILASAVNGCVLISVFTSLVGIPIGISSSVLGLKICALTAGIKKRKSIFKKKKLDKLVFLANLNSIEVLIYRTLIDSYINHDDFVSVNNVLEKYDDMKEAIKDLNSSSEILIYL